MNDKTGQLKKFLLAVTGTGMVLPCMFFAYYTIRLIYINLTADSTGPRPGAGMYIGFVVFPVAAIVFGVLSWLCFRTAFRKRHKAE
jgi:hypothetical protein